jgi:hypothetical protein
VAVEVPELRTIAKCWQLVNTSESTRRHSILLENCCYGYNEMLVLNMVRAGKLGEITQGRAACNRDISQRASGARRSASEGKLSLRRFEREPDPDGQRPRHHAGTQLSSPQPYDRINLIAATKGIFRDYPPRVYLDGDQHDEFGPIDPFELRRSRGGRYACLLPEAE